MNSEKWNLVQKLFEEALDLEPSDRKAFLQKSCASDKELYDEVLSLISEDTNTHTLLDGMAVDLVDFPENKHFDGQQIGAFRIIRQIGSGGMGAVYLAERIEGDFEQKVALKLIKRGMDSEQVLQRFRSERQILAMLEHPNIARLLDGGITDDGQPYFAMEYVEGKPIDEYCDENKLPVKDRLKLFQKTCSAVQYAHQNLIVHRDLKPSNILVSESGDVKLLDFGIAKMLSEEQQIVPIAALTRTGLRIMTPEFAAPEQVQGGNITTTTDVYALGVLLFRLLTGMSPYRVKNDSPLEIEKAISTSDPDRPSTILTARRAITREEIDPTEILNKVSQMRNTRLDVLRKELSGDLDNICLKALRKEPERRYQSAEQLSDDISRYFKGLPVQARPDTFSYRARKFIQRKKVAVASTTLVVLVIIALVSFYTIQLAAERDRAQLEAQKAAQVSEFLSGLFAVADPSESKGETITARELLDTGARRIKNELADQPEVQAAMMNVVGNVYRSLGLYKAADTLLQDALRIQTKIHGEKSLKTAEVLFKLAQIHYDAFEHESSSRYLNRALVVQQTLLPENSPEIIRSRHMLAQLDYLKGEYVSADSIYQAILLIIEPSGELFFEIQRDYGVLKRELGDYAEAERIYRKALEQIEIINGELHPETSRILHDLGDALRQQGKLSDAETFYRRALKIREQLFEEIHPDIGETLNHLARLLYQKGNYDAAEPMARRALKIRKHIFGDDNVAVVASRGNLAGILLQKGNLEESEKLYRRNLSSLRKIVGEEHPYICAALNSVARILLEKRDLQESEKFFRQSLDLSRIVLPENHHNIARPLLGLGQVFINKDEFEKARPLLTEAFELTKNALGESHWRTAEVQAILGECLLAQNNFEGAEVHLLQNYKSLKTESPDRLGEIKETLERIVELYQKWGRLEEAKKYAKKL